MQRERHSKFEITLIRKTRTNSSDFALKFTSYFLKTGTTSSQKQNLRCDIIFSMVCSKEPEASLPFFYNQKPEVRPPKKSSMNVLV